MSLKALLTPKVIAIVSAGAVAVGGAVAGVAVYNNTPEVVARNAIVDAFEELGERPEIAPIVEMLEGGSLEFSVENIGGEDAEDENMPNVLGTLMKKGVRGKMFFSKDAYMLKDLNIPLGDETELNFGAYVSKDKMYISEDNIIEGAYGLELGKLAEAFENSIFAYGSDSPYAIQSEEVHDQIVEILEGFDNTNYDEMSEELSEILSDYAEELWATIEDEAEFESETKNESLTTGKDEYRVVTITLSEDAIQNIAEHMISYLIEDDAMVEFLDKNEELLMTAYRSTTDSDESLSDIYTEALEELEEEIEDNEYDGGKIVFEIVTPKLSAQLLKLKIKVNDQALTFDFGEDGVAESKNIEITTAGKTLAYEIEEKDNKTVYTLDFDKENLLTFTLKDKGDEFDLKIAGTKVCSGTFVSDDDVVELTIEKIFAGVTEIELEAKITIKTDDDMPKPESFESIGDITEEDIEAWGEKFSDLFGADEAEPLPDDYEGKW